MLGTQPSGLAFGKPKGELREIRGAVNRAAEAIPDFASLNPGYSLLGR
jgi:hypothetical protein